MSKEYRVVSGHVRSYDVPVILKKGATVTLIRKDDPEYKEWYWCRSEEGKEAWIPELLININGNNGIITRDYNSIELTVSRGDNVTGFYEIGGWEWCKNTDGEEGWVPLENLEAAV